MRAHESIAAQLAVEGTDVVFGVLGEANMLIVESLVYNHGVTYVKAAREGGAVLMANGFSRMAGRVGVATVTSGPGLTNAITPIIEGVRSRTPLVVVAGDTTPTDTSNLAYIDQAEVVRSTGAGVENVASADVAGETISRGFRRAVVEQRPIVLNVPVDVQLEDVEPGRHVVEWPHDQRIGPDNRALDRALGAILSSNRPLVIAGRGAVASGARDELVRLADLLGAPLATTLLAKGFFNDHSYNIGIVGTLASGLAGSVAGQADCILSFGASLNEWTTAHGTLTAGKRVVACDRDPERVGKWPFVDVGIVADAKLTAGLMCDWIAESGEGPSGFRTIEMRKSIAEFDPQDEFEDASSESTIDPRTFTIHADKSLPSNRAVVSDGGHFALSPLRYLDVSDPLLFTHSLNFGAIGLALPVAIGAAFSDSSRPVVVAVGDGGLMMELSEITTAVRHELPLVILVFNDNAYGAEYHNFLQYGSDVDLSLMEWPNLASTARALGAASITVKNVSDLDGFDRAIEQLEGPVLVDVRIDPALVTGFLAG